MMLPVICKEQEEQSGMKPIHFHPYGNFMNQAVSRMVLSGCIGEQKMKLRGKKITVCGWLL